MNIVCFVQESMDSPEGGEVEAIYDHEAQQSGDLPFKKGDRIRIVKECKCSVILRLHVFCVYQ